MIVLCVGMIRSGSTWSYNFAANLLRASGRDVACGGYSESFATWVGSVPEGSSAVIKCHAFDPQTLQALQRLNRPVRAIFTYRDAGPAIASGIRAFALAFEQEAGAIGNALDTFTTARDHWETLPLRYDSMHSPAAAAELARFLEIDLPEPQLRALHARHRREAMKRLLQAVDWQAPDGVYRDERYTYHQETLLHRTHFADKEEAQPRFELTPVRRQTLEGLAGRYAEVGLTVGEEFFSNRN